MLVSKESPYVYYVANFTSSIYNYTLDLECKVSKYDRINTTYNIELVQLVNYTYRYVITSHMQGNLHVVVEVMIVFADILEHCVLNDINNSVDITTHTKTDHQLK